jgi:hypothetical protein
VVNGTENCGRESAVAPLAVLGRGHSLRKGSPRGPCYAGCAPPVARPPFTEAQTGWSIRKFVNTARRCRTIGIQPDGRPSPPPTLFPTTPRQALDASSNIRRGAHQFKPTQDLDGSAADGTVRFGLDATEYEIDLNSGYAQELRDALARYVKAARRAGSSARRPARSGRRGSASGPDITEVREWAKAQGLEVKDRGRVPADLVVKFKAATAQ